MDLDQRHGRSREGLSPRALWTFCGQTVASERVRTTRKADRGGNPAGGEPTPGSPRGTECPPGCPCAGKTGEVVRMEFSYGEGVANHTGPASCAVVRKGGGEALTGVDAGRVLSRENCGSLRGADAVDTGGRLHRARRHRETRTDPARSETPSTHGNTSHGSREIPRLPAARGAAGRTGKSEDASR